MSRSSTLILLGALTILAPFSGLPMAFRSLITIACGAIVLAVGLTMRTHRAVPVPAAEPAPEPLLAEPPHTISPI